MSAEYWADRQAAAQAKLTEKTTKQTEAQLKRYYSRSMGRVTKEFEMVYNKIDRGLEKLGEKQIVELNKAFVKQYQQIYSSLALPDREGMFNAINKETAQQMINEIWCADGKSWSDRIWENTDQLQQALNDNLIECVVNGKPSDYLVNMLQEQFNTSFYRADSLVKTELCHIQTQAARQRYEDMGIKEVQVWAEKDERQCEICGKLHTTKYPVGAVMPIPAHPRCRCTIIPVID